MSTLFSCKRTNMNIGEYENYVHSVRPLPVKKAAAIKNLFDKLRRVYPFIFGMDVVGSAIVVHCMINYDLSTPTYFILAVCFVLLLIPFWVYYKTYQKYFAYLLPYGLNVDDISTREVPLSEYRKLSTVSSIDVLLMLRLFIEYRNGVLLEMDLKALRIDEYFQIITPHPSDHHFDQNRSDLVKQILHKAENVNWWIRSFQFSHSDSNILITAWTWWRRSLKVLS